MYANRKEPHLSVGATGDDLVNVWVVTHSPKQPGSDHHFETHKTPTEGKEGDKRVVVRPIKDPEREKRFTQPPFQEQRCS